MTYYILGKCANIGLYGFLKGHWSCNQRLRMFSEFFVKMVEVLSLYKFKCKTITSYVS